MRLRQLLTLSFWLLAGCGGRTPIYSDSEADGSGVGGTSRWSDFGTGGQFGSGAADGAGGGAVGSAGGSASTGGGVGSGGVPGTGGVLSGTGGALSGTGGALGSGGSFGGSGGVFGSGGGSASGGAVGTGGAPNVCRTDSDCVSADACLVGRCEAPSCSYSVRDQDGDGYSDELCGGSDCNDLNALANPGEGERCRDGSDNDCNGVVDCLDPVCAGDADCGCVASDEVCNSGADEDCDGAIDCNDPDCTGNALCGCAPENCENGSDDDCDGAIDCDDADCSGAAACSCQETQELCRDGVDQDCDGAIDCSDPDCSFDPACLCLIPSAENCNDGRDNDCNGLVDCGDPSCFANLSCAACSSEVCGGGLDEDCDGKIDCADSSCAFDPACPAFAELCNNERDDDFDGLTDCDDTDCAGAQVCVEQQNTCQTARRIEPLASATYEGDTTGQLSNFRGSCGGDAGEAVFRLELNQPLRVRLDTIGTSFDSVMYVRSGSCEFGREIGCDDDSGGVRWSSALTFEVLAPGTYFVVVDGLTVDPFGGPNEGPYVLNVETEPPVEICDDAFDNDGNGLADCADIACAGAAVCIGCNGGGVPVAEFGPGLCTDGVDNDCDGLVDCDDEDCSASEENITECCTGTDQNGNGIPDDFNCRCIDNSTCPTRQICYTSTVGTCGIPCNNFFGEICPFLAPGSSCNLATGQCEF